MERTGPSCTGFLAGAETNIFLGFYPIVDIEYQRSGDDAFHIGQPTGIQPLTTIPAVNDSGKKGQ